MTRLKRKSKKREADFVDFLRGKSELPPWEKSGMPGENFLWYLCILYVSSIFLYLYLKDIQISTIFVQTSSIREEKITMYGRIYALFGSFLACQFLFCYDPSEGVPNLIFSLYLWRKIDKDMRIEQNFSLEKYNTFHLPVKTRWFLEYDGRVKIM